MARSGCEVVHGWIATSSRDAIGTFNLLTFMTSYVKKSVQDTYDTLHIDPRVCADGRMILEILSGKMWFVV